MRNIERKLKGSIVRTRLWAMQPAMAQAGDAENGKDLFKVPATR